VVVIYSNPQLLALGQDHLVANRKWNSSADPFYEKWFRPKPEILAWLAERNMPFIYGESSSQSNKFGHYTIYFEDPRHATLFKLTWL
jgi:hypothetical protein